MTELPTFYAQLAHDNPDHALVLCGVKDEWEHAEDHDAVLRELEPTIQSVVGEVMNDRMFDRLEATIRDRLYHMLRTEQIYLGFGVEGNWLWAANEKARGEAAKAAYLDKYPWLRSGGR